MLRRDLSRLWDTGVSLSEWFLPYYSWFRNGKRVKAGNVVEYSRSDKTKWISATADFPKAEVVWDSLAPNASTVIDFYCTD